MSKKSPYSCKHTDSLCFKFHTIRESEEMQVNDQLNKLKLNYNIYDRCECGNITLIPKKIMSTSNHMDVRFKVNVKSRALERKISPKTKRRPSGFLLAFKFIKLSGK